MPALPCSTCKPSVHTLLMHQEFVLIPFLTLTHLKTTIPQQKPSSSRTQQAFQPHNGISSVPTIVLIMLVFATSNNGHEMANMDSPRHLVIVMLCSVLPVNMGKLARSLIHMLPEDSLSKLILLVLLFLLITLSPTQVVIYHSMLVTHCHVSISIVLSGLIITASSCLVTYKNMPTPVRLYNPKRLLSLSLLTTMYVSNMFTLITEYLPPQSLPSILMHMHKVIHFVASVLTGRMALSNNTSVL